MQLVEYQAETPKAAPASVVSAHDLTRRYGSNGIAVDALRGVSVDVASGELTAVMGPSGSGKSTLMHILAGLDRPTTGEVRIAGTAIGELNDTQLTKLRREHIGFIFQFFNLLPMLTAKENIVLPLSIAGEKPDPGWIDELTAAVGLGDRLSHRPSELSGGQQQPVAIVLGVAMISGAFVLTDTLGKSFDGIYADSYEATDAVISSKVAIKTNDGSAEAPAFSATVLDEVERLPGVRIVQGSIEDEARF